MGYWRPVPRRRDPIWLVAAVAAAALAGGCAGGGRAAPLPLDHPANPGAPAGIGMTLPRGPGLAPAGQVGDRPAHSGHGGPSDPEPVAPQGTPNGHAEHGGHRP